LFFVRQPAVFKRQEKFVDVLIAGIMAVFGKELAMP
jgi:hypothetical protein